MKKIVFLVVAVMLILPFSVNADNQVNIYFFYGEGCSICKEEKPFLDKLEKKYSNLKVHRFEVWDNEENRDLMFEVGKVFNREIKGVPFTVIGEKSYFGFTKVIEEELEQYTVYYSSKQYTDKAGVVVGINVSETQGENILPDLEVEEVVVKKEFDIMKCLTPINMLILCLVTLGCFYLILVFKRKKLK